MLLTCFPHAGVDLLRRMLVLDPAKRIDCRSALKHPYFHDIQTILANPPQLG
jgi:cyclin-dependent kinase